MSLDNLITLFKRYGMIIIALPFLIIGLIYVLVLAIFGA